MNNNIYKYLVEASINSESFSKYEKLNKIRLKSFVIDSIVFDNGNFIALTAGLVQEDIPSIPNYKKYIRSSFDQINTCFVKDFNLKHDVLGPLYFKDGTLGVAIVIHKDLPPLKEIQTILNIIFCFLAVDYVIKFPSYLIECSLENLGISHLLFFPLPTDEDDYLYILKVNMIDKESLIFQVSSLSSPENMFNLDFLFSILYYMMPNIMKYSELKPEYTWLIPHNLQYYLMPKEIVTDEFEMACDYKYHKIAEFVDAAFLK